MQFAAARAMVTAGLGQTRIGMRMRRGFLWLHRYLGLAIVLFLTFAGLTGSVLVFRIPLDAALNADLFCVPATGAVLPPARIADGLARSHPAWRITKVPTRLAPGESLMLTVTAAPGAKPLSYDQVFVDPHDGKILGTRADRTGWGRRHIVQGILEFHQNLLGGTAGRWFMGIVAFGWVISNLIGIYLTFPTLPPFWQRWTKMWRLARRVRFPRFCLDLHRAGGLWLFIGMLVLAVTSVEINFYDELFAPAVTMVWGHEPSPFDAGKPALPAAHHPTVGFEDALAAGTAVAERLHRGWRPVFLSYDPARGLYGVSFMAQGNDTYAWLGPAAYYFSDRSGQLVYTDDPYRDGARGVILRSLYPLHSGFVWGWPTRALIFALGLATAILSLTGFYVWYRKRRS